jgi:hypothetical protein
MAPDEHDVEDAPDEPPRKEKVLHTRVPAVLEQELKRLAKSLRVPVSNVVRAILEDAVDTMDVVGRRAESELRDVADRLSRERVRVRRRDGSTVGAPLADVVGYQELRLARDEACTLCGAALRAGARGWLGIRDGRGPRVLLGDECLPSAAKPDVEDEESGT